MSSLHEIQTAIGELSTDERQTLLYWLLDAGRETWDRQIAEDFLPAEEGRSGSPTSTNRSVLASSAPWSKVIRSRNLSDKQFRLFRDNPAHPPVGFARKGEVWTAEIGRSYRAVGRRRGEDVYWFGSELVKPITGR